MTHLSLLHVNDCSQALESCGFKNDLTMILPISCKYYFLGSPCKAKISLRVHLISLNNIEKKILLLSLSSGKKTTAANSYYGLLSYYGQEHFTLLITLCLDRKQ